MSSGYVWVASNIVIWVGFGPAEIGPLAPLEVCTAPTGVQLRKYASGVMPMGNAGRSAIHSALSFVQVVHDCTVEKLFAGLV